MVVANSSRFCHQASRVARIADGVFMQCLAPNSSMIFFFPCDGGDYRLERGMGWVATNEEAKSGEILEK